MSRTKTARKPAPRPQRQTVRPAAPAAMDVDDHVYEYRFPIPGHPLGGHAYIALRRHFETNLWAVTDGSAGTFPEQFWDGTRWQQIMPWVPTQTVYGWELDKAREEVPGLLEQGQAAHEAYQKALETVARIQAVAAVRPVPAAEEDAGTKATARHARPVEPVMEQAAVVPLGEVEAKVARAEANLAHMDKVVQETKPPAENDTVSIPAPCDRPDYQPEPPDPEPDNRLLSLKAQGIPANTEQETVALDVSRLHGPDQTALMPAVEADEPEVVVPPMPDHAPDEAPAAKPAFTPAFLGPVPLVTWRGGNLPASPLAGPDLRKKVCVATYTPTAGITVRLAKTP